ETRVKKNCTHVTGDEHASHTPYPQSGGDLATQELGGRTGDHDVRTFAIDLAPHEPLPTRDVLDLVEDQGAFTRSVVRRAPIEDLQQLAQVTRRHVPKALVLEVDVEQRLAWRPLLQALSQQAKRQRRLANPAHPNDDVRLARQNRYLDVARRQLRKDAFLAVGNQLLQKRRAEHSLTLS